MLDSRVEGLSVWSESMWISRTGIFCGSTRWPTGVPMTQIRDGDLRVVVGTSRCSPVGRSYGEASAQHAPGEVLREPPWPRT